MRRPPPISPRGRLGLLLVLVSLCAIPVGFSLRSVTLDSVDIFTTHEWLPSKPVVYFHCKGENKTYLPDVKEANLLYTFKGEESWQPLTELPEKKCKRCGLYEEDTFKYDDVYDEWEFCSSDFKDGKYTHFKERQFSATFLCADCTAAAAPYRRIFKKCLVSFKIVLLKMFLFPLGDSKTVNSTSEVEAKKTSAVVVIIISVLALVIVVVALVGGYRYWQKKKRERDQARFLKLFEEGDDIEDELGLAM